MKTGLWLVHCRRCEAEHVERASQSAEVRLWIPGMHCKSWAQLCYGGPNEGGSDLKTKKKKKLHKTNLKDALVPSQSVIEGCQGKIKDLVKHHYFNLILFSDHLVDPQSHGRCTWIGWGSMESCSQPCLALASSWSMTRDCPCAAITFIVPARAIWQLQTPPTTS